MGGFRPQGGIPNPVPTPAPPPSQFPGIVSDIPLRLSKSSRPASRGRDHDFEGGLGESPRSGSRLLQPPLSGGKGVRRLETRDRPLPFQRVRTTNSFQDGNCLLSPPLGEEGQLPGLCRPERRLLPDTHPHLLQEMAPFRFGRNGPPVQSPLLRVINCPAGLHQSLHDSVGLGPHPGGSSSPVPGRLASTEARARQHVRDLLSLCNSLGVVLNREKSDLNPSQSVEYLGMTIETVAARAYPTVPRIDKFLAMASKFLSCWDPPRPALAVVFGTHVIAGETGPLRKTQNALAPMASEVTLVPGERPSQPPSTSVPSGRGGPPLVDGEGPPTRGDTLRNADPRPPSIIGCVPSGLGSSPP